MSVRAKVFSIFGVVALLLGALLLINLGAREADGSDAHDDSTAASDAAEANGGEEGEEKKKAPVPVEVATITTGTISSYITSSANLVAENQVKVLSEVEGRLAKLLVEEGDYVKSGQTLALLVRDDAEIALKKAELKETNARLAFERGNDLMAKELISREEHDRFTMEYEIANQELAEARWRLEKTTFRAPFGGRVSERMTQPGQHVRPGDELFQITALDPLVARIYLPERDVIGLEVGREVRIKLNADEEVSFAGRIRQISPIVDVSTGTIKVTVEAKEPPRAVRPGSFVSVAIVREVHAEAALLPREAVLRELQSAHVFVIDDSEARKRTVTLGLEEGDLVEVTGGVEPGERVIVAGQGGLKDGSPVKILEGAEPGEAGVPAS